jgi:two-component system NtrC family response regulator
MNAKGYHRALQPYNIEENNHMLYGALRIKQTELCSIIGKCAEMQDLFSIIGKVAPSDASILISGESGTGKELIARAIHNLSSRRDKAFVPINCSAIPDNLLESELFGYERGAFTGAHTQTQGKVELAEGGSLFLDEIVDMPINLQVKMLRFLQEMIIQRIGGRKEIHVDSRIVAATNTDIIRAIEEGRFREDLFYRIAVITIEVPPLRERKSDIMLLAEYFLEQFRIKFNKKVKRFASASIELLESYDWPGNVRELENVIQRGVIIAETFTIEPHNLEFSNGKLKHRITSLEGETLQSAKMRIEKEMISSSMMVHGGNISRAARELGISRPTLYDLLKKHGIKINYST